jgi:transketolase
MFVVPNEVTEAYHKTAAKGAELEQEWEALFKKYAEKYDAEAKELTRLIEKKLPEGWQKALPTYSPYAPLPHGRELIGVGRILLLRRESCPRRR